MAQPEQSTASHIQPELELQTEGVSVYRWHLSTGDILIEVFADGSTKVNGESVGQKARSGQGGD